MGRIVVAALVLVGALFVVAAPATAHACNCVTPGFELISPSEQAPAPRNAVVRVSLAGTEPVEVSIRAAGIAAAADATFYRAGDRIIVEAAPRQLLAPHTEYEVVAVEPGLRRVETVVGVFRTGASADHEAPAWRGARRARWGRGASKSGCATAAPLALVDTSPAIDADTASAHILYAVWLPDAGGAIDLRRAPSRLVRLRAGRLHITSGGCDSGLFTFPTRRRAQIAVAAVDQAGNRSKPVRVRLSR